MKPDWKDAPEWANYLAMDYDGTWYWYRFRPIWKANWGVWVKGGNVGLAQIALSGGNQLEVEFRAESSLEKRPNQ